MRFFSPMSVNPHPGGFAQRRISELPSVTAPQMREIQRVAQEDFGVDIADDEVSADIFQTYGDLRRFVQSKVG